MKRFLLYCLRWQMSSPIIWFVLYLTLEDLTALQATVLANFVGSCVFFWVDKWIFRGGKKCK